MSENVKHLNIGIHEILRYMLPGCSFLSILFLSWFCSGLYSFLFIEWEKLVAFLIFGGFFIGYLLYYPYYWFFQTFLYIERRRESLNLARRLLRRAKADSYVRAIHSLAFYRGSNANSRDKAAFDACVFQFSVFHSIGSTACAILLGLILAFIIPSLPMSPISAQGKSMLQFCELWLFVPTFIVFMLLCFTYWYRFTLAVSMEDSIVIKSLLEVIEEDDTARNRIQKSLQEAGMRERRDRHE